MHKNKEVIKVGISIGDVNGIGLEVLIDALSDPRMFDGRHIVLYGNSDYIKAYKKILNRPNFQYARIKKADELQGKKLHVIELPEEPIALQVGVASKEAGRVAFASLQAAVNDLASNKIDVLVTLPINKDSIQGEGFDFPGHTEYLANFANVDTPLMLLIDDVLRVGVATGHVSIKEVSEHLTQELLREKLTIMEKSLRSDFGIHRPKIAVLGLNPHAGDNGLIGDEEINVISPVIKKMIDNNKLIFGPFGADGFFGTANYKQFDGVMAMYHDQGLIPFKTLAFDKGVNFTAGLPIVRTSPDHGTAHEIAGKGEASSSSFRYAIFTACDIYEKRKEYRQITTSILPIQPKKKKSY